MYENICHIRFDLLCYVILYYICIIIIIINLIIIVTVDEVKQLRLAWIIILWMAMGTRFLKPLFHFPSHKGKKRLIIYTPGLTLFLS
jgi:hypothetical protein